MNKTWTDPTGNLVLESEETSGKLSLLDRVLRVRIATWSDGYEAWRFIQSIGGQRHAIGPLAETPEIVLYHPSHGTVRMASYMPQTLLGKIRLSSSTRPEESVSRDKLRWLMVRMGMIRPGASPIPESSTIAERNNPYIGRFKGRTLDEVRADAADVDLWLSRQPEKHLEPIRIGSPLFADRTELWRSFVEEERQTHSTIPARFRYDWALYRQTGEDSLQRVVTTGGRTLASLIPFFMDRESAWKENKPMHPSWRVLPLDDAEQWWRDHSTEGQLTIGADEVEVLQLLGEALPWFWSPERVSLWAIERWAR